MSFTLRLFGGATIEAPGGPLTGRAAQRHRLALLALLATSNPGGLTRDKLVAYLWPESTDERGRRLLSDSVYRVHRALGEGTIRTVGDALHLDAERLPSDVAAFEEAVAGGNRERATAVYVGPFLDGFHLPGSVEFERWVDRERARLAREYARALETLAGERERAGDRDGAVDCWRRRAAHDPYDSRVAARLMEALAAVGNRAGALRHARIHAQLLESEFGSAPSPEVLALAERLRSEEPGRGSPAPPRSGAPAPGASAAGRTGRPGGVGDGSPGAAPSQDRRDAEPEEIVPRSARPPPADARPRGSLPVRAVVTGLFLLALGVAWIARAGGGSEEAPPGLAVLPFANLDADDESLYFADGITEEVLTNISRIGGFRVVSRASVMPYRDAQVPIARIAGDLDVRYLLEGSVRRSANDVRIAVQLVDARDDANIWAESYERPLEDIFAVQGDIARRVAEALQARLTPDAAASIDRAPTADLEAYNLYLRGRWFWHRRTQDDLAESARFFRQALERDPGFGKAWAGLADALAVQAFYDYRPPGEAYPEAKRAAERALEIDETLPEAHASLGYITLYHDWDAAGAEAAFQRSVELNPSYSVGHQWYANLLVATARFEEAERAMSRARQVNPLSLIANGALGWVYYYSGRYEDALEQCDLALEMHGDWDLGHLWRGLAFEALGRTDEAIGSLERAVELSGGSGITVAALAHARAIAGDHDEARELLRSLVEARAGGDYRPSFEIAKVHVALGDHAEAVRWLERAHGESSHSMVFLEVDPQLAPLRESPDFRRLVAWVALGG